jgi:hypothetical protein
MAVKFVDYDGDSLIWKDTFYFDDFIGYDKNVEIKNIGSLIK